MERDGYTYATVEDVNDALDVLQTARAESQIYRNLRSASGAVEGLLRRKFYPEVDTRYFDWPARSRSHSYRLWLEDNELISVSSLVVGGVTIASSDYFLRNGDGDSKPPYDRIEIDLASTASFQSGDTWQQAAAITGLWCSSPDESRVAGTLDGSINSSVDTIDVSDGSLIGVGDLVKIGTERVAVVSRRFVDSVINLSANVAIRDGLISVGDGSVFNAGEKLLVGAERMLITDIAGNNLVVKRGWDGSLVAAHTSGADVYVSRRLSVVRGALGTTAASHTDGDALTTYNPPGLIKDLTIAEAMVTLLQQRSGMARTIGSADFEREIRGTGLADLRDRAISTYGRMARIRAV